MNKITFYLLSFAIITMACVCAGGSPQTNTPAPVPATTFKVTIPTADTVYSYGDSFTSGSNASVADSAYAKKFANYYSCVLVNRGVGGTTVSQAWLSLKNDKNSGINETVTLMTGVNNYRGLSHDHPAFTLSYVGYLKSAITLQFLKSRVPATSNLVTLSGTWDSSTTNIVSSTYTKYLHSSTANSTATYNFTDSTVVIGTFGSNGYSIVSGYFDVSIDGTFKGRFCFGAYGIGGYTPQTLVFRGLTFASHSIVITKVGTQIACFDYFGHLKDASICKPIIIGEFPNWNKADFTTYLGANTFVYVNSAMCSITNDFYGYNTTIAPVNTYLNPNADIDTDNVHPTNQGHRHIFDAFKLVTQ